MFTEVEYDIFSPTDYDLDGDLDIFITGDDTKETKCQLLTNTNSADSPRSWRDDTTRNGVNITCVHGRPRIVAGDFDADGLPGKFVIVCVCVCVCVCKCTCGQLERRYHQK